MKQTEIAKDDRFWNRAVVPGDDLDRSISASPRSVPSRAAPIVASRQRTNGVAARVTGACRSVMLSRLD